MCNLQFILIANTFLPLHTHHSNPSYIFLHVLFVFRAVSQVIVPVIPWFWELVSCTDLSGAKEIYYSVRLSKKVMDYEIVAKCCTRPVHFKILTISFTSKKVMDYEIVAKCCTRPVHFKILTISFTRIYSMFTF